MAATTSSLHCSRQGIYENVFFLLRRNLAFLSILVASSIVPLGVAQITNLDDDLLLRLNWRMNCQRVLRIYRPYKGGYERISGWYNSSLEQVVVGANLSSIPRNYMKLRPNLSLSKLGKLFEVDIVAMLTYVQGYLINGSMKFPNIFFYYACHLSQKI